MMADSPSRRDWLQRTIALLGSSGVARNSAWGRAKPAGSRRLLYNYDGWGPFLNGPSLDAIDRNVDMFQGTALTTIMFSPNVGQSMCYPSEVSEFCHTVPIPEKDRAQFNREMGPPFVRGTEAAYELWSKQKIDAFGRMVERSVAKGFETFAAFRMNDVHMLHLGAGGGAYSDRFYREHPEYRVPGSYNLNYAVPEVRQHRLRELEELISRYPFRGLELDFVRGVPFFSSGVKMTPPAPGVPNRILPGFPHYLVADHAPTMSEFVGEVRAMTKRVSRQKNYPILLGARVPSSLSGCLRVGLDPMEWHKRKYLDFLTISPFLQLRYDLPVGSFKAAAPDLPIYSCLDYTLGGPRINGYFLERTATPEMYRGAAAAHYSAGADGLQIFNMFVPRGYQSGSRFNSTNYQDPVEVLKDLSDPKDLENKRKLYLVDRRFEVFDKPFYDVRARLPQEVTPPAPLITRMRIAERSDAGKRMTLRVEAQTLPPDTQIVVQVNGQINAKGTPAPYSRLFEESHDALPPDARNCVDFPVAWKDLRFGENEIVVMSSNPITIERIELAVDFVT